MAKLEFEARVYGSKSRDTIYMMLIWVDEGILCSRTIEFGYQENEIQVKEFTYFQDRKVIVTFTKTKNDIDVKVRVARFKRELYIRAHVTSFVSAYTLIRDERNLFEINS